MQIKLCSFSISMPPLFKENTSRLLNDCQKKFLFLFLLAVGTWMLFNIRRTWNHPKILNQANDPKVMLIEEAIQKTQTFPSQQSKLKDVDGQQEEIKKKEEIEKPVYKQEQLKDELEPCQILDLDPKPVFSSEEKTSTKTLSSSPTQNSENDLNQKDDQIHAKQVDIKELISDEQESKIEILDKKQEEQPKKEEPNNQQGVDLDPEMILDEQRSHVLTQEQKPILVVDAKQSQVNDEKILKEQVELKQQELEQLKEIPVLVKVNDQELILSTKTTPEDVRPKRKPCGLWNEIKSYLEKHRLTKKIDVKILEAIAKHFENKLIPIGKNDDLNQEIKLILENISKPTPSNKTDIDSQLDLIFSNPSPINFTLDEMYNIIRLTRALNDYADEKPIQEYTEKISAPKEVKQEIKQENEFEEQKKLQVLSSDSEDQKFLELNEQLEHLKEYYKTIKELEKFIDENYNTQANALEIDKKNKSLESGTAGTTT